jgi:hypothetical protein
VTASDRVIDFVCMGLDESVTLKVRLAVPTAVGVPEMVPVAAARLRPAGSVPLVRDQVYGVVPPVALSELLNDRFAMPPAKLVVLIASGTAAVIERARTAVVVWAGEPASLTVTPILKLPLAVGVPEIRPVDARVSPVGRVPEVIDHVYGEVPPAACSALE